jgi:hypothetical protein
MKTLFLSLVLLFSISCNKIDDENSFEPQTITPVLIGKGDLLSAFSSNPVQQNIIITNTTEWNNFIVGMNNPNNLSKNFSEINVDFNNFQIIAVFDNIKQTGGFSIDITNVVENPNNIVVTIKHLLTGGDNTIITQPFHIVKIPKTIKPIVFQ